MKPLDRLLAERAIERLIVEYAAANDAGEWPRAAAMFVENGRMARPTAPDAAIEGREAILASFLARPPRSTRHIVTNMRVDVTGDTATAISQLLLFTAADRPPLVGTFTDALVNTPEGWRFAERRGALDFQ